ncbi:ankyrin repeat domain-containing protein 52 [Beauveria bassiana ARSEF 2860]|uniref:Ankyrin repeat domain-containing protein 52 n=1 Tax=Beauveria bassiana (strain ARSEF 2860) TaxID=655819 RepID=J4KNL8_BEAB2|nr:ankyrin repeat domain-containing protein 52 [Beauveria bassiana ARSEF 2860]EJP65929.1 ankyrin repeat domain-containing protein 52 [Beauveria bassiana ARSEF 2860]
MENNLTEDVFLQEGLCPTIAEHAAQCSSLFQRKMAMTDIVPDPTIVDDQLARFTLWANNMDVYGPLNVSLDYRLRYSPTVVQILHQLLDVICETLDSCENTDSEVARRTDYYDSSDSDSELDHAEENISKITITIHGTVTRLFRLSNAVRKSAKANRARKIERYIDDEEANTAIAELRLYTECYIRFRFPEAPDSLRKVLVKANELRLRRLYYQRSHRRRIDLSIQNPQFTQAVRPQLPKMKEAPRQAVSFAAGVFQKPERSNKPSGTADFVPAPATNATTARQTAVGAFYAKSTTEVPRAKSIVVNNKLSFPPIPSSPECPYCGVIIELETSSRSTLWQNHVIGDLEPFICVFPHCLEGKHESIAPPTFETSKTWISHMQNAHGHAWECRAPSHAPIMFKEEIQYQEHSIREHGVPETHAGILSSAARRPILDKMLQCPFNDDFQPPEKVESSLVFASEALQSHIAGHLKEIALLTLQKLPSDEDENTVNFDSDQPLVNEVGPGLVQFRGSMYSVLDDDEDLVFRDDDCDAEAVNVDMDIEAEGLNSSVRRLDLEDKNEAGMTTLHHAVQTGDLQLAESLIQGGANLRSRDKSGRTIFHYVFVEQSFYPAIIDLLLSAGDRSIMNLCDDNGQTALHYAAQVGNTEGIKILTDNGVDADSIDNYGFTPLLWAVVAGKTEATEKLLSLGAGSPDSASPDGKSALAWAVGLSYINIAQLLLDRGANLSRTLKGPMMMPLDEAAAAGNHFIVHLLLEKGANPNSCDRNGWSAIHWAAEEGHLEVVRLLLEAGANVNAVSSYGTSALHCAANGGHAIIVKLLLSRRADALKANCHGWTALHHAAYMGHFQVTQCLLEDERMKMNASYQDNHGWSVLHLAVHNRDLATIKVLLGSAAIEEPRGLFDESGLTPEEWLDLRPSSRNYKAICNLAFGKSRCCRAVTGLRRAVTIKQAVTTGNIPMINLFLSLGHDVNGMNSGRRTALYYAAKKRMLPIMNLLLEHGADPNILPAGRKAWKEFISDDDVIQLLKQAGYRQRDPDRETARQIRLEFGSRDQGFPDPDRSVTFAMEDSTLSPKSERSSFPTPQDMSNMSSSALSSRQASLPNDSASNIPTQSMAAPTQQTKSQNKRKADSLARPGGVLKFWKRLTKKG